MELVKDKRQLEFIDMIKITTNGTRLNHGNPSLVERLKHVGIDEINISLHSLSGEGFKDITSVDALKTVLNGIELAVAVNMGVSINCLIREETFSELDKYIELSERLGIRIKFFGILDASKAHQDYADGLLERMKDELMRRTKDYQTYLKPYGGMLFEIGNAVIDLKDSRVNNCPVTDCKVRDLCLEGCRYHARLSPAGILQPCGVRTDNLIDMKDKTVTRDLILEKLINGGKILAEHIKGVEYDRNRNKD
ncbi:MAG: radical SAM protein [Nitrososphaeria archaeon]